MTRRPTTLTVARRVGIVVLFVLVLLRPGFGNADAPVHLTDVEVLVVVDRTRSMAALDHADRQPRIEGVKADLADLVQELPGARFGLLTFGADARLTLPLTTDTAAFVAGVETLDLEGPRDGTGSRADRPVPELREALARAEATHPERRRMVVYLGDGEDTESSPEQSFAGVRPLVGGGIVLGYGTEEGARMPVSDELDGREGYVRDPETGGDAVSRADLDNLARIADELGVRFEHRDGSDDMAAIARSFEASYVEAGGDDTRPAEHDLTWLAGLGLLALLLGELVSGWRALWTSHRTLLPPARGAAR